jgi:hypothetical protein
MPALSSEAASVLRGREAPGRDRQLDEAVAHPVLDAQRGPAVVAQLVDERAVLVGAEDDALRREPEDRELQPARDGVGALAHRRVGPVALDQLGVGRLARRLEARGQSERDQARRGFDGVEVEGGHGCLVLAFAEDEVVAEEVGVDEEAAAAAVTSIAMRASASPGLP